MQKTVAVTGASGHIGNVVCRKLIELGYSVKAFYHSDATSLKDLELTLVKGDVLDPTEVSNLLTGCDYVINCAAIISINGDPSGLVYKTNTQGPANILSLAKELRIKKIIHVSSVHAVHDLPHNTPYDETRPYKTKKDFAYDYSKAQGEQIILSGAEPDGVEVVVVRPSCVIGPHDFKPSKMGVALKGFYKKKFLFLPNGGYDLVDVRDLSASICTALELGKNKEIYLLSGKYYRFKDLAKEIGMVREQKKTILILPNWLLTLSLPFVWLAGKITQTAPSLTKESIVAITEGHPEMNNEKARSILHHKTRPLQESLRDIFNIKLNNT
jgi:dihydroflavonol-4-reductase